MADVQSGVQMFARKPAKSVPYGKARSRASSGTGLFRDLSGAALPAPSAFAAGRKRLDFWPRTTAANRRQQGDFYVIGNQIALGGGIAFVVGTHRFGAGSST